MSFLPLISKLSKLAKSSKSSEVIEKTIERMQEAYSKAASAKPLTRERIKEELTNQLKGVVSDQELENALKVVDKLPKKAIRSTKTLVIDVSENIPYGSRLPGVVSIVPSKSEEITPKLSTIVAHEFAHGGFNPIVGRLFWVEAYKTIKKMSQEQFIKAVTRPNPPVINPYFIEKSPKPRTPYIAERVGLGVYEVDKATERMLEGITAYIENMIERAALSRDVEPYYGYGPEQALTAEYLHSKKRKNPWLSGYRMIKPMISKLVEKALFD